MTSRIFITPRYQSNAWRLIVDLPDVLMQEACLIDLPKVGEYPSHDAARAAHDRWQQWHASLPAKKPTLPQKPAIPSAIKPAKAAVRTQVKV